MAAFVRAALGRSVLPMRVPAFALLLCLSSVHFGRALETGTVSTGTSTFAVSFSQDYADPVVIAVRAFLLTGFAALGQALTAAVPRS